MQCSSSPNFGTVSLSQGEVLHSSPQTYLTLCHKPQTCNLYRKSKFASELQMQGLGLLALSEGKGSIPEGPEALRINCRYLVRTLVIHFLILQETELKLRKIK